MPYEKAVSGYFLHGNLLKAIEAAGITLEQTRDEILEKCKLDSTGDRNESS